MMERSHALTELEKREAATILDALRRDTARGVEGLHPIAARQRCKALDLALTLLREPEDQSSSGQKIDLPNLKVGDWVRLGGVDIRQIVEILPDGRILWCSDSLGEIDPEEVTEVRRG